MVLLDRLSDLSAFTPISDSRLLLLRPIRTHAACSFSLLPLPLSSLAMAAFLPPLADVVMVQDLVRCHKKPWRRESQCQWGMGTGLFFTRVPSLHLLLACLLHPGVGSWPPKTWLWMLDAGRDSKHEEMPIVFPRS